MSSRTGRPRAFDRTEALRRATLLFWQHGYEATSIKMLTTDLAITPPSLYAAFGGKEALFHEAVEYYRDHYQTFVTRTLAAGPTAREAIADLLHGAVDEFTNPQHPRGCLIVTATITGAESSANAQRHLAELRTASAGAIEARIEQGRAAGEPLDGQASHDLAAYVITVFAGLSNQARDGLTPQTLHRVVDTAMQAWPRAPEPERLNRRADGAI